jgi:hypothetical protein
MILLITASITDLSLWVRKKCGHLTTELFRQEQIITVKKLDEIPPGQLKTPLSGRSWTGVNLVHNLDNIGPTTNQISQNGGSFVSGTIIDENNFYWSVSLGNNTINRID